MSDQPDQPGQLDLAVRFEEDRPHLRAVAYRMLGSTGEADDAVQDAWLKLARADTSEVENLRAWLTTVVSRVCLDRLRSRASTREHEAVLDDEQLDGDPSAIATPGTVDPEDEVVMAESVGLALLVVLDTLSPSERLAFVLHDLFALSFDEVAPIVGRTPEAARQLASRARRRVRGASVPTSEAELRRRQGIVEAFLAASRTGDVQGLLAVLDPDVVLHADENVLAPGLSPEARGAEVVAGRAKAGPTARLALVDGSPGIVNAPDGELRVALTFRIEGDRIVAIEVIGEPERLAELEVQSID